MKANEQQFIIRENYEKKGKRVVAENIFDVIAGMDLKTANNWKSIDMIYNDNVMTIQRAIFDSNGGDVVETTLQSITLHEQMIDEGVEVSECLSYYED